MTIAKLILVENVTYSLTKIFNGTPVNLSFNQGELDAIVTDFINNVHPDNLTYIFENSVSPNDTIEILLATPNVPISILNMEIYISITNKFAPAQGTMDYLTSLL